MDRRFSSSGERSGSAPAKGQEQAESLNRWSAKASKPSSAVDLFEKFYGLDKKPDPSTRTPRCGESRADSTSPTRNSSAHGHGLEGGLRSAFPEHRRSEEGR